MKHKCPKCKEMVIVLMKIYNPNEYTLECSKCGYDYNFACDLPFDKVNWKETIREWKEQFNG